MHRNDLLHQLAAYQPIDDHDADCRSRLKAFVRSHPDCFERSLQIGHVTGSAWIVDEAGTHVLLTHHRKLDLWVQLGGHADGCADVFAVATKEAKEESGIASLSPTSRPPAIFDLDIHPIPARAGIPEHLHYDVRYAFTTAGRPDFTVSDESHALAWVSLTALEEFTREPSMLRMRAKWRTLVQAAASSRT